MTVSGKRTDLWLHLVEVVHNENFGNGKSSLAGVEEDPFSCIRRITSTEGIYHTSVWRAFKSQQPYLYHVQRVQALPKDEYLLWSLKDYNCLMLTVFGFSPFYWWSRFFLLLNFHNTLHWADENQYLILQLRH